MTAPGHAHRTPGEQAVDVLYVGLNLQHCIPPFLESRRGCVRVLDAFALSGFHDLLCLFLFSGRLLHLFLYIRAQIVQMPERASSPGNRLLEGRPVEAGEHKGLHRSDLFSQRLFNSPGR